MKKKYVAGLACMMLTSAMLFAGCGEDTQVSDSGSSSGSTPTGPITLEDMGQPIQVPGTEEPSVEEPAVEEPPVEETPVEKPKGDIAQRREQITFIGDQTAPEGKVYSELTGLAIDASLEDQRPIAVMVDNESIALPHYGLTQADVVYEMMNSTLNGRITRLMCLVKDWETLEQFGSVRSARTTNCILAAEYNAVLCHDGGPFYINDYVAMDCVDHLSGVFSRVANGKAREYTEYICTGDLKKYLINSSSISTTYNKYYTEDHFNFVESDALYYNDDNGTTIPATWIDLPFPHNSSCFTYNADDNKYYYYEYDKAHVDPQNGNAQLNFTNLIIMDVGFAEYDPNGYLYYTIAGGTNYGYYCTDGKAIPITWSRGGEMTDNTKYFDMAGNELVINAGKTYIALVPADAWGELCIN